MKTALLVTSLALLLLGAAEARADSRYARGESLYLLRCDQCFKLGWKWSPDRSVLLQRTLIDQLLRLSDRDLCTWQRSRARKGTAQCRPDPISVRERHDLVHYLIRRVRGPLPAVKVPAMAAKQAVGVRFKPRAPFLLQRARQAEAVRQARAEFLKRGARSPGKVTTVAPGAPGSRR